MSSKKRKGKGKKEKGGEKKQKAGEKKQKAGDEPVQQEPVEQPLIQVASKLNQPKMGDTTELKEAKMGDSSAFIVANQETITTALNDADSAGYVSSSKKRKLPDGAIAARNARRVRRAAQTKVRRRTPWQKIVSIYVRGVRRALETKVKAANSGAALTKAQKKEISDAAMRTGVARAKEKYQPVMDAKPQSTKEAGANVAALVNIAKAALQKR